MARPPHSADTSGRRAADAAPLDTSPFHPGAGGGTLAEPTLGDELFAELRARPAASRPLAISRERRFARRELVERLIAEAHGRRFDDAAAAVELARLAVAAAARIRPGEIGGSVRLHDLRAEAAAALANSLRVSGEPHEAERAFLAARDHLGRGSGEPLLAARLADLEASLCKDQRRFDEAQRLLEEAITAYRRAGLEPWVVRSLVKLGSVLLFAGRYQTALRTLRRAVPLLRPESDPHTFVICAHNLVDCLNRIGYSIAARSLVTDLRRLHQRLGDGLNLLRLDWLEAQIDLGLGAEERAVSGFLSVRAGFLDREMPYFAALASLELAEIYARRGDPLPMQRLAEEMLPIFQSRRLHREAIAALIVFREAVAMRQASVELIRDVGRFLRDAQRDRSLRFRPRG